MRAKSIVYLFTDQLRADALTPPVKVPNLNRLMDESLVFTRCVSNSPLCVPARASLMTGLLPRTTGVWSNARAADPSCPSHVRNIRTAGYHTAVVGKTHLWRTGVGPKPGLHAKEMDHYLEKWGFDTRVEVNDPIGTGSQGCAYTDYLEELGCLREHQKYIRAWIQQLRSGMPEPWNQPPSPVPEGTDIDSFIGRTAIEWLDQYDEPKPFYLQVQFTGPHDPYDGPQRLRDVYSSENIEPGIRQKLSIGPKSIRQAKDDQIRQWRINYYANVTLIDEWVGNVIEALDRMNFLEDCWIVFCSDHGEMLGDHGGIGKANFFDASMRVPCFVRPPGGISRTEVDDLIEQVDLTATLLEIAGADPIEQCRGVSLLRYSHGSSKPIREAAVSELFGITTIETDEWKLSVNLADGSVRTHTDRCNDPKELKNLAQDPDYQTERSELVKAHIEPLDSHMDRLGFERFQTGLSTS